MILLTGFREVMKMTQKSIIQQIMEFEHFKTLTPIQEKVVSRKNKTRDLIGISSTGSGKSHAFFMAIFEMIDPSLEQVQAVISTPTRELAYQLYERCRALGEHFGISVKRYTGGTERKMVSPVPPWQRMTS